MDFQNTHRRMNFCKFHMSLLMTEDSETSEGV